MAHTLAVNDVAVALVASDQDPNIPFRLESLTTEPKNWRSFVGASGERRWLKPDLHLVGLLPDEDSPNEVFEEHHFVEMDLGSEHLPRIQEKCRIYASFAHTGAYEADHGLFPSIYWLSADAARRAALERAVTGSTDLPPEAFRVASPEQYLQQLGVPI